VSGGYAQTAQVLQLLDEVYRAHRDGRDEDFDRLSREVAALDALRVGAITGGMAIGEIPDPARNYEAWCEFVQSAVDAATEELAQATSCGDECGSVPADQCCCATAGEAGERSDTPNPSDLGGSE
jgi:hypothetical protein